MNNFFSPSTINIQVALFSSKFNIFPIFLSMNSPFFLHISFPLSIIYFTYETLPMKNSHKCTTRPIQLLPPTPSPPPKPNSSKPPPPPPPPERAQPSSPKPASNTKHKSALPYFRSATTGEQGSSAHLTRW